ncbi:MAG: CotH kinase family protein [Bacteroidales bacterium]|nr:CotH kinase family protein [Bacteroidales bacterium]
MKKFFIIAISILANTLFAQNYNPFTDNVIIEDDLIKVTKLFDQIFSHKSGFYYEGFNLYIEPPPSFTVLYTVDGSNPLTSPTVIKTDSYDHIYIYPISTNGRGITPAYVIRASLYKEGYKPTSPVSRTFIFPENVAEQTYPMWLWPSKNINGQKIDYAMSTEVTLDDRYKNLIDDALLEIPSISIITDMANLFDKDTGIYVNSGGRGLAWERNCNAELIFPDGSKGFTINCGLRIRGGASRSNNNPKHSLRLFFREEYGSETLNYPLFENEGADVYYKVDLRTAQNYSWNGDAENNNLNTLVRDIYSRDVQRAMDQPYTRGRYYHLYLNGMYWGIYQTQERAEGHFAETYLGGDNSDYDVIKVSPQHFPYSIELADGSYDAWKNLYRICGFGITSVKQYYSLEGKDENGLDARGYPVLLDIDNLIDYMIVIIYTGNFDAPASSFWGNKMPNNFYAINNRKDKGKGFVFCAHDSEHSMMIFPVYVGEGLYENRVNLADRNDWFKMEVEDFTKFHPQWLHYKLSNVEEYRVRFADRAYRWLSTKGILSVDSVRAMILKRAYEIDTAIIAESARWGDSQHKPSRTKDNDWVPQINNLVNTFAESRTSIVINQLKEYDLYPKIDAPKFYRSGNILYSPSYPVISDSLIEIKKSISTGTIYYTLDGSDPRLTYGEINPNAVSSDTNVTLVIQTSCLIKARLKNEENWSALKEVSFLKTDEDYSGLKVTEIHYHPKDVKHVDDPIDGKDLEFIELKNTGENVMNISGIHLDSAVTYTVPANTLLYPKQFYVIASKPEVFFNYYGWYPNGNFKGNLSNGGEFILLNDPAYNEIFSFTYSDKSPWPEEADGHGYSLVTVEIDPTDDPGQVDYWRKSLQFGGSPFLDDTLSEPLVEPVSIENYFASSLRIYPNPCHGLLTIELDNSNNGPYHLELYSQDGRLVYHSEVFDGLHTINFASFHGVSGIYILKIVSENQSAIKKILYLPY